MLGPGHQQAERAGRRRDVARPVAAHDRHSVASRPFEANLATPPASAIVTFARPSAFNETRLAPSITTPRNPRPSLTAFAVCNVSVAAQPPTSVTGQLTGSRASKRPRDRFNFTLSVVTLRARRVHELHAVETVLAVDHGVVMPETAAHQVQDAIARPHRVVAPLSLEHVAATAPRQFVRATATEDQVARVTAGDRVIAAVAAQFQAVAEQRREAVGSRDDVSPPGGHRRPASRPSRRVGVERGAGEGEVDAHMPCGSSRPYRDLVRNASGEEEEGVSAGIARGRPGRARGVAQTPGIGRRRCRRTRRALHWSSGSSHLHRRRRTAGELPVLDR